MITAFVAELVIISVVAMATQWVRVPYTLALVATGLGLGWLHSPHLLQLTPELLFTVLLPPILFESALNLHWEALRANLGRIALLATVGLLLSTGLVGWGVHAILGLPMAAALVFGALISATDPISVLALFKQLKAPLRLTVIVEGESLFNDGVAVVVFNLLQGFALGQRASPWAALGAFVWEAGGGLAIGCGLGWLIGRASRSEDHLLNLTLSTMLAFGSFLLADGVHASGVMAVIGAGLVYGNHSWQAMSPNSQLTLNSFWEYLGFLANSLVFLLIGTQAELWRFAGFWWPVMVAFAVVLLARALMVAMLGWNLPPGWRRVTCWAGLRGSIAIALAMALDPGVPHRETILFMTYGVALLSLFAQSLTMPWLLRRLGLTPR